MDNNSLEKLRSLAKEGDSEAQIFLFNQLAKLSKDKNDKYAVEAVIWFIAFYTNPDKGSISPEPLASVIKSLVNIAQEIKREVFLVERAGVQQCLDRLNNIAFFLEILQVSNTVITLYNFSSNFQDEYAEKRLEYLENREEKIEVTREKNVIENVLDLLIEDDNLRNAIFPAIKRYLEETIFMYSYSKLHKKLRIILKKTPA